MEPRRVRHAASASAQGRLAARREAEGPPCLAPSDRSAVEQQRLRRWRIRLRRFGSRALRARRDFFRSSPRLGAGGLVPLAAGFSRRLLIRRRAGRAENLRQLVERHERGFCLVEPRRTRAATASRGPFRLRKGPIFAPVCVRLLALFGEDLIRKRGLKAA